MRQLILVDGDEMVIFSFLSSGHEKATEALFVGRIQIRRRVTFVPEFSG